MPKIPIGGADDMARMAREIVERLTKNSPGSTPAQIMDAATAAMGGKVAKGAKSAKTVRPALAGKPKKTLTLAESRAVRAEKKATNVENHRLANEAKNSPDAIAARKRVRDAERAENRARWADNANLSREADTPARREFRRKASEYKKKNRGKDF